MWGMPFTTFLSFVVLATTIILSVLWAIYSNKDELDDTKENKG